MQVTLGPYAKAAERYFRTEVKLKDIEQIAADYAELDMIGVLLAWDAETATGLPPLGNDYIAEIVKRYPQQFIGFASVDPHKGKVAINEMERAIKELGLAGAKFHPGVQAFYPNDPQFYPLMEKIQELRVPALFHTGTNGLGAGTPGGMGIKLDYTRPIYLDSLAADFPGLTIIGAHPSWPWHEEMIASIQHKTNIFNDLSGWSHPTFNMQISIARSSGPSPKHQAAYRLRPLFTSASALCTKSLAAWSVVSPAC